MSMPGDFRERLSRMTDADLEAMESAELTPRERELLRQEQAEREESALSGTDLVPVSVVVRDFDMPFLNIVVFTVKWVVASIPALIILLTLAVLITGLLVSFLREFR